MLTCTHPRRQPCKLTDDSQQGTAGQCACWAGHSWGQWVGTVFEVSLTSSYSADRACPPLPTCRGGGHTNHTGGQPSPRNHLALQAENTHFKKTKSSLGQHVQNSQQGQTCICTNIDQRCFCVFHIVHYTGSPVRVWLWINNPLVSRKWTFSFLF